MADHGTSGYRRGCRCEICKKARADYMRERRARSIPERTKTKVARSNVVSMSPARILKSENSSPGQNLNSEIPGEQEAAVIARFDQLGTDDAALVARCRAMARLLDDDADAKGAWVSAAKQLDVMMARAEQGKIRKSRGKLVVVQQMSARRRSS